MSDRTTRDDLIAQLDGMLAERARIEDLPHEEQADWASVLARQALGFAADLCGPSVLAGSYDGTIEGGDRAAGLARLAERLWIVSRFFSSCSQADSISSIEAAANEATMVANGDKPKMFAPLAKAPGKRSSAQALAHLQLLALETDTRMEAAGVAPSVRHSIISQAFGQPWDTISRWKSVVTAALGSHVVDLAIRKARREVLIGARPYDHETDAATVEEWGATYKRALGFSG